MASLRNLGYKVFSLIESNPEKKQTLLKKLNFSESDLSRLINGRLALSFNEIETISKVFSIKPDDIVDYTNTNCYKGQVFICNNSFSSQENCNKILDLIDVYIDIKEAALSN